MKLLLDTHSFLWLVEGFPNLSAVAQSALTDSKNDLFLSVASIWEIAIKSSNKKLILSEPLDVFVNKWISTYQLQLISIEIQHALTVANLPAHHRDPFDRILIAQAIVNEMALVSADTKFAQYSVPIIW